MLHVRPFRFYHKVGRSNLPWWITTQVGALFSSLLIWLKYGVFLGLIFSCLSLVFTVLLWGSMTCMEGLSGNHLPSIQEGMMLSFSMFLLSEAMFFMGIFWSFFDSALNPSIELGGTWVPIGIVPVNPYGIPLFNTVVLLSSGLTATLAHHKLLMKSNALPWLLFTLFLAFMFESAQYVEFKTATFSMSDGVFGSVFFFGTGFHGLHVIFGHLFLTFNAFRLYWNHFTRTRHISFSCALIYWHFVDVIWILLYICFYWWSW